MLEKVLDTIEQFDMLHRGDSVVIGLSGGADSVALAHILLRLAGRYSLTLSAVHVNHNIRTEGAMHDQQFVEKFCAENSLPLKVYSLDIKGIAQKYDLTLEEAGRQQRYAVFKAAGADKTAVAHNLNDNAETMIMRLCRGTGLKGMGGILPVRDDIIRPLIMCSRDEIESYCRQNGLNWCTDETNLQTDYTRNKIRHLVLPVLKEINPDAISVLGKNALIFRQENDLVEQLAAEAFERLKNGNTLDANDLSKLNDVLRYRVYRIACENAVGLKDIAFRHIEIIDDLLDKPVGRRVDLPKGLCVIRDGGGLTFVKKHDAVDTALEIDVPVKINGKNYLLTREKGKRGICHAVDCGETQGWRIRTRRQGDIFMRADGRQIKLKKFFTDMKIPVSRREDILLLARDDRVYLAEGIKNKFKNEGLYLYLWEDLT